jgi:Fe-S-cluster containining protein
MSADDSFAESFGDDRKQIVINEDILCRIEVLKSLQESFECKRCGECCKQQAIAFTEKDILIASRKVGLSPSKFIEKNDLVLINDPDELEYYQLIIGKIGVCPFYSDHACTIYDARPQVCRGFPFLTPKNVQNAFKMNNEITLGSNCKEAIAQLKGVSNDVGQQNDVRTKKPPE